MKRIGSIFALMLAMTITVIAQLPPTAPDKSEKLSKGELRSLIATATTPEQHRRVAQYYEAKTQQYFAESHEHQKMTVFDFAFLRSNNQASVPRVPHFFADAKAAEPLPRTLEPTGFSNRDVVAAYRTAKEIPKVLAQQPCYCHCDRNMGHRSLLDCFAGKHGSECDICGKEALFAMQEHRKDQSPEQI